MTPTDDEVLALAEKIKEQRYIDSKYAKASVELKELKHALANDIKEIRHGVRVEFGTIKPCGYINGVDVDLPVEAADDLIQLLQDYIAKKQITNN